MGVAPEVRANYVTVGSNLKSCFFVLITAFFSNWTPTGSVPSTASWQVQLKEQLAAKEEELRVAAGIFVLISSGGR